MITVYEIKPNGFLGQSKQIDPREGVGSGWTYTAPPGDGPHKWEFGAWVACDAELEAFTPGFDFGAAADTIRQERNARIAATDWTQGKDIPDYISAAWAPYRQALRDISSQPGFPMEVQWPETPVVVKPETTENTRTETTTDAQ